MQVKLNVSLLIDINDDLEFCFKVAKESIIILPGNIIVLLTSFVDSYGQLK